MNQFDEAMGRQNRAAIQGLLGGQQMLGGLSAGFGEQLHQFDAGIQQRAGLLDGLSSRQVTQNDVHKKRVAKFMKAVWRCTWPFLALAAWGAFCLALNWEVLL